VGCCPLEAHCVKKNILHPEELQPVRNKSLFVVSAPIHHGIIKRNQKIIFGGANEVAYTSQST